MQLLVLSGSLYESNGMSMETLFHVCKPSQVKWHVLISALFKKKRTKRAPTFEPLQAEAFIPPPPLSPLSASHLEIPLSTHLSGYNLGSPQLVIIQARVMPLSSDMFWTASVSEISDLDKVYRLVTMQPPSWPATFGVVSAHHKCSCKASRQDLGP
ncbi:hypothetical protein BJV74DRAFT_794941 [Russula compacta]|nr:hypothetical protein BJV74DRAFT_794941 [Russula compacta]